jgi:hypothetical protein
MGEQMFKLKADSTLRTGLFLTSLAWFTFTFYEFVNSLLHNYHNETWNWLLFQETGGCVGLGLRTAGGLIAVIAALFYLVKRDLSEPEALMALRIVIILEASYWLSFLFSISPFNDFTNITTLIENNLPIIVQATILPIVLIILFFNLAPKRVATGGLKWGLISGTVYILVLWLNNAGNWIAAATVKGLDYLTLYPANMFSFLLTVVGLLLLTLSSAYFTKKTTAKNDPSQINLRTAGFIVTAVGLYFDIIYVMFLILGPVGGWGMWYAWFTGHNLDLWIMALPFTGLPLLLQKRAQPA